MSHDARMDSGPPNPNSPANDPTEADGEIFDATLADVPPPNRRTSWAGIVMIGIVVSILMLPLLYVWGPQERARWQQAAAEEQRLEGDLDGAISSLDKAVAQFPEQETLYFKRAEWLRDKGDFEQALEDCNRGIEMAPHAVEGYMLRSQILQSLGRFEEAVADLEKPVEFSGRRWGIDRATALNNLAYARALANTELEVAFDEVEEALTLTQFNPTMLDTRGFVRYLLGDLEKARADLDDAVRMIEADNAKLFQQLKGERTGAIDRREFQLLYDQHSKSVAVIRYHRSLVLDSLGESEKAEQDRQRIVELGHEPSHELF